MYTEEKRIKIKRSTVSGVTPIAPTSAVTNPYLPDESWDSNMCLEGELFANIADNKVWLMSSGGTPILLGSIDSGTTFINLTDTPSTYTGQGSKIVRVNNDEDALEFYELIQVTDFGDLYDVPNDYTGFGGYSVVVNNEESGLTFTQINQKLSGMTDVIFTDYDANKILITDGTGFTESLISDVIVDLVSDQVIGGEKEFTGTTILNNTTIKQPLLFEGQSETVTINEISTDVSFTSATNNSIATMYATKMYIDNATYGTGATDSFVTLYTNQTITGSKIFNAPAIFNSGFTTSELGVNDLSISGSIKNLITSVNYFGDDSTDGSYREYVDVDGEYKIDKRIGGVWVNYNTPSFMINGAGDSAVMLYNRPSGTTANGSYSVNLGYSGTSDGICSFNYGSGCTASGDYSSAGGLFCVASGKYSHAEGYQTIANGTSSHAEGYQTTASGFSSHAEGIYTTASGSYSHAEGSATLANNNSSHAEGYNSSASGSFSHAEGWSTTAFGEASHSEGSGTTATGYGSHAEGDRTDADGIFSHAEGKITDAIGEASHAEGYNTTASGIFSHAEGKITDAIGEASHAEGYNTTASGSYSHSEGSNTTASGTSSHAEGRNTTASGIYSHSEGYYTTASTTSCHAEGYQTSASGTRSHAEGSNTLASGHYGSHSEGYYTTASTISCHAEGYFTLASGNYSHAEGTGTTANGIASHAGGYNSISEGNYSTAINNSTISLGQNSFAGGVNTTASGTSSFNFSHSTTYGLGSIAVGNYSAILGGTDNNALHQRSIILGGNNITSRAEDTTYVSKFEIVSSATTAFYMTDVVTGLRKNIVLSGGTLVII